MSLSTSRLTWHRLRIRSCPTPPHVKAFAIRAGKSPCFAAPPSAASHPRQKFPTKISSAAIQTLYSRIPWRRRLRTTSSAQGDPCGKNLPSSGPRLLEASRPATKPIPRAGEQAQEQEGCQVILGQELAECSRRGGLEGKKRAKKGFIFIIIVSGTCFAFFSSHHMGQGGDDY